MGGCEYFSVDEGGVAKRLIKRDDGWGLKLL
jgi:hypothetical protein